LAGASLFLDFDGTLVELASTPDAVRLGDDVKSLLGRLQDKLSGRLALLSGRSLADVRSYLHPLEVAAGGSHGLELAHACETTVAVQSPPGLAGAIAKLKRLELDQPGVIIEEKPGGVAVHYRQAPGAEATCREIAARIAAEAGMALQPGKMVVELKHPATDKGRALKRFMEAPPFTGTRPIFLGDDLTDEDGFASARELGGAGILVGPERPTHALYRLDDVASVQRWLSSASDRLP
jgi:trehalose 6-phosphate phosphatase